jgi:hypothetical protein
MCQSFHLFLMSHPFQKYLIHPKYQMSREYLKYHLSHLMQMFLKNPQFLMSRLNLMFPKNHRLPKYRLSQK